MAIRELFSKRQMAREKAGQDDVYQYEILPEPFRVQVIHIWGDVLGGWRHNYSSYVPNVWWGQLFQVYIREKGVFALVENDRTNPADQCREFLLTASTLNALDLIELTFHFADTYVRGMDRGEREHWRLVHPDQAINELNYRFREHGVGYEFAGGQIVRVDSKYIHAEAVLPALQLLHNGGNGFSGPLQEFHKAHEHYRKGESKDAIAWACKSFESTLKAICIARGWSFDPERDAARKLLETVFANELVPTYVQSHVSALRAVLEAGVPTLGNRTSRHGQGSAPIEVPEHYAAFVMHMTASNIVFLIESYNALT